MLDTDYTGKNQNTTDDYLYADNFEYTNEEDVTVYNATTGKGDHRELSGFPRQ